MDIELDINDLSSQIAGKLFEYGALDIQIIQTQEKSKIAKRLVVCTAQDNQAAKKMAIDLKEYFKTSIQSLHTDGIIKGEWVVIDYKDIIVHIFTKNARQKYNIEKLWKDSKNTIVVEPNQLTIDNIVE